MEAKSEYGFRTQIDRINYQRIILECTSDDSKCEIIRVTVEGLDGPEPITLASWRLATTYDPKGAGYVSLYTPRGRWFAYEGDHVDLLALRNVRVEAF